MGASLILGSFTDSVSRAISGPSAPSSSDSPGGESALYANFITERNAERLANALCRMRGAALKLGQLLSIQDENVLPPQVWAGGWGGAALGVLLPGSCPSRAAGPDNQ
jgi:aarF domain-containing kinase